MSETEKEQAQREETESWLRASTEDLLREMNRLRAELADAHEQLQQQKDNRVSAREGNDPKSGLAMLHRLQTCRGSFLAASKPVVATTYAFFSII